MSISLISFLNAGVGISALFVRRKKPKGKTSFVKEISYRPPPRFVVRDIVIWSCYFLYEVVFCCCFL